MINVSGRFDDYSDFGSNFSPKVGVKFTPIKQIAQMLVTAKNPVIVADRAARRS